MKKIILMTAAIFATPLFATPNGVPVPYPNQNARTLTAPTAPNANWGNNRGGNWNMPNFNMGNNGYRNGSNWSMPNMNWGNGNGFRNGSNWNMPNMNWGSGNNGSNMNMPKFNWNNNSNRPNGGNWNMPSFNMGNNTSAPGMWRNNQNYNQYVQPRRPGINAPAMPKAPRLKANTARQTMPAVKAITPTKMHAPAPQIIAKPVIKGHAPSAAVKAIQPTRTGEAAPQIAVKPVIKPTSTPKAAVNAIRSKNQQIPTPNDIKGTIVAPVNKLKDDAINKKKAAEDKHFWFKKWSIGNDK